MAYLYCLPLNDTIVKIGSHSGDEKSLDNRYGTYVCKEHLEQKVVVPVELNNRFVFEQALHALIRRHDGVHKEKEKYTNAAKDLFLAYVGVFAMREKRLSTVATESETDRLYRQMREEKRLQKIVEHEQKKKQSVHDMIKAMVVGSVEKAISSIPCPTENAHAFSHNKQLFDFLSDNTKVRYEEGAETYLCDVKDALQRHLGEPVTSKLDFNTFTQVNPTWTVTQLKICRLCQNTYASKPKCCPQSDRSHRTSGKRFVPNLVLNE